MFFCQTGLRYISDLVGETICRGRIISLSRATYSAEKPYRNEWFSFEGNDPFGSDRTRGEEMGVLVNRVSSAPRDECRTMVPT